jgi:hypothetical protein
MCELKVRAIFLGTVRESVFPFDKKLAPGAGFGRSNDSFEEVIRCPRENRLVIGMRHGSSRKPPLSGVADWIRIVPRHLDLKLVALNATILIDCGKLNKVRRPSDPKTVGRKFARPIVD